MNQTVKKVFLAGMVLVISVVLVVAVTYAWTTLSTSPVAEGIQISIGGGNTILLAPDLIETVDGTICHYPGNFTENLVFSRFQSYDYLKNLTSLSPVSTSDGLNWFTPSSYTVMDEEVRLGQACVGDLKDIQSFQKDSLLSGANLESKDDDRGHYIYLDFWVVSPGVDYTLRISRGENASGSYLIELPRIVSGENGFSLENTNGSFAASARVGFLVNMNGVSDKSMKAYQNSRYYNDHYKMLLGAYQEKGSEIYPGQYRFMIYEPNGNLHSGTENGFYVETKPVGLLGDTVSEIDIRDRLSVQLENTWVENENHITLDQLLTVATAGKSLKSPKEAEKILYDEYLQGQFSPYISRGKFISETAALYEKLAGNEKISGVELAALPSAGATSDQFIVKLIKNVPQRIRMFVWIEGQDMDCSQITESGRFALSLELAGSNQD